MCVEVRTRVLMVSDSAATLSLTVTKKPRWQFFGHRPLHCSIHQQFDRMLVTCIPQLCILNRDWLTTRVISKAGRLLVMDCYELTGVLLFLLGVISVVRAADRPRHRIRPSLSSTSCSLSLRFVPAFWVLMTEAAVLSWQGAHRHEQVRASVEVSQITHRRQASCKCQASIAVATW